MVIPAQGMGTAMGMGMEMGVDRGRRVVVTVRRDVNLFSADTL